MLERFNNKFTRLAWLLCNERRSLDELVHIQEVKLKRLVKYAYENVQMYRDKFRDIGFCPGDLRGLEDLKKLPIVQKRDFQVRHVSELLDKNKRGQDGLIPILTSGSSGAPLRFLIDKSYDQLRKAQFLRPYISNGQRLFERTLCFTAYPERKKRLFQLLGLLREERVFSGEAIQTQLGRIHSVRPSILKGYPSVLSILASEILYEGISIPRQRLVFTDSELLTPPAREMIKEAFQADVIDIYGTNETENIAYECQCHEGYHVTMDTVILELTENDRLVDVGRPGEVVCTVLDNLTMPFIRYNLHDLAVYSGDRCSCGITFPLIKSFIGRSDDQAFREDGSRVSTSALMKELKSLYASIREFQVVQEEINLFKVFVVLRGSITPSIKIQVKNAVYKCFPNAWVTVHAVNQIEREKSGKFRTFRCLLSTK